MLFAQRSVLRPTRRGALYKPCLSLSLSHKVCGCCSSCACGGVVAVLLRYRGFHDAIALCSLSPNYHREYRHVKPRQELVFQNFACWQFSLHEHVCVHAGCPPARETLLPHVLRTDVHTRSPHHHNISGASLHVILLSGPSGPGLCERRKVQCVASSCCSRAKLVLDSNIVEDLLLLHGVEPFTSSCLGGIDGYPLVTIDEKLTLDEVTDCVSPL